MNDSLIWSAFKSGDRNAFQQIYAEHAESLLKYAYRFSRNDQLTEDCLQDLFIYLWDNKASIGETNNIRAYLLISYRRRILKVLKQEQKQVSSEESEIHFQMLSEDNPLTLDDNKEEQRQLIRQTMDKLSGRQKEIVYLKYYQQLDYEEICEVMGISYQSARNLLLRTLKSMRDILSIMLIFIKMCFL